MDLTRGKRVAALEERGLVAQDHVAHGGSGAIDPERRAPFVAEGEVDLVPRKPRALEVEGSDETVPRLDGAVGIAAPVQREPAFDGGGERSELRAQPPRPGRSVADGQRIGLLVQLLRGDARTASDRHRLVPAVGDGVAQLELAGQRPAGVRRRHVEEQLPHGALGPGAERCPRRGGIAGGAEQGDGEGEHRGQGTLKRRRAVSDASRGSVGDVQRH